MNKRTLKEGFVKVLSGEKNIITVGNIKLGKKTRWNIQYILFLQDTVDKKFAIYIFETQNDAYKNLPKSLFNLDAETDATQMVATLGEQFCVIVSSSKETLTFSCNSYGELLDWISHINRYVKGIARVGSKQGNLPPIPKDGEVKKDFKRGTSEPGKMLETESETQIKYLPAIRASTCDMENNSIYGNSNIFAVDIVQNDTADRLKLEGCYNLSIHDDGIHLLNIDSAELLHYWPVRVLRRFGSSNSRFSFESGRSSRTGVGQFEFFSPSCKLINEAVTQLTERVKTGMNANDIYQRDSKSPLPLEQSPLTNSHHAIKVQSSFAKEKFSEQLNNTPAESVRGNPIASVDSLNEKFHSSEDFNLSKQSLPFEIESTYGSYSIDVKNANTRIRSQISNQEPNYIKFNTSKKPTTDLPDYINITNILKVTANEDLSDDKTPMNAPMKFERMRSESEPTQMGIVAGSDNNTYVNLQNFSLNPQFTPPTVHVSKASDPVENIPIISESIQRSVHSHSTHDLSQMFEEVETKKHLTSTLPKSFSSMQLSPQQQQTQQQQQQQPQQQQQQLYYPPSQHYIPPVQRYYQPTHQQSSHPPSQYNLPYLQPQPQRQQQQQQQQQQQYAPLPYGQQHTFQMGTYAYPKSAPSSGAIDPAQRPTPREGYPGSAPNSGYHLRHRDLYNAQ